jgi:hypothetical protein
MIRAGSGVLGGLALVALVVNNFDEARTAADPGHEAHSTDPTMTEAAPPRASLGHIRPRPPNTSQSGRCTCSEFCQSSRVGFCSSSSRNPPLSDRRHPPTVPSVACRVALFIFRVRQTLLRFPSHSRPASSCMSGWTGAGSDHSHPPTSAASKRSAPVVGDRVGVETRAHPRTGREPTATPRSIGASSSQAA